MLERTLGALGIFILGLHLIWSGCEFSNVSHRMNPLYGFFQGFFFLERAVLMIAAFLGVLYLAIKFWPERKPDRWSDFTERSLDGQVPDYRSELTSFKKTANQNHVQATEVQREPFVPAKPVTKTIEEGDQNIKPKSPEVAKAVERKPTPLSRAELKRRAMLDLTRR